MTYHWLITLCIGMLMGAIVTAWAMLSEQARWQRGDGVGRMRK